MLDRVFENLRRFVTSLSEYGYARVAIEMLLIGVVVFVVVRFLQGTRGARLLKGALFVLVGLYLVVSLVREAFPVIAFLYDRLMLLASFAFVVIFQPELQRALMRLGEAKFFQAKTIQIDRDIDQLVSSAVFCSRNKIGMLIAIEREVGLAAVTENATRINADLSTPLLNSIFYPNSPLHDLGVIVSGGRIMYAGAQFPLAESGELERELGSRHRAAVGMSQESDAVVLVVSEETGDVSIAERGILIRKLTPDALRDMLQELLGGRGDGTLLDDEGVQAV
jgi:diadenylate cyclase